MFGEDVIPRPPGAHRKSKVQRSSSLTSATSGSQKEQFTELMQTQINLNRGAKKEHMERELAARLAVCEIQKRNGELKILTFDNTGMNPADTAKIEALKPGLNILISKLLHMFCFECIRGHVSAKVTKNISKVRCPDPNCKGVIGPEVCWSIVPKEVLLQWEKALCESLIIGAEKFYCPFKDCSALLVDDVGETPKTRTGRGVQTATYVEKNTGCEHISCRCGYNFCYECNDRYVEGAEKFYCPFKDCSALLVDDVGETVTSSECPHCNRLFCAQCKVTWHSGMSCSKYQSLGKDERDPSDIMLMNLAKNKNWKRCPNC
nr:zinc finger, C6HC-type [Tanacetum cinerariifolium]